MRAHAVRRARHLAPAVAPAVASAVGSVDAAALAVASNGPVLAFFAQRGASGPARARSLRIALEWSPPAPLWQGRGSGNTTPCPSEAIDERDLLPAPAPAPAPAIVRVLALALVTLRACATVGLVSVHVPELACASVGLVSGLVPVQSRSLEVLPFLCH